MQNRDGYVSIALELMQVLHSREHITNRTYEKHFVGDSHTVAKSTSTVAIWP